MGKMLRGSKLFTEIFADGAAAADEALEVALFVIEFVIVPGVGEDFDPFISEHADDGVEGLAVGLVIAHEGTGPAGVFPAFGGPFMKALAQKVRAV